jgi:hypothetical protein
MSKERQIFIESEVIKKLPWVLNTVPYLQASSKHELSYGVLYKLDSAKIPAMSKLLNGKEYTLSAKDKVYVLPGHPMPMFKIKEYVKQAGCSITNNLSNATVILGHDNIVNSDDMAYSSLIYKTDAPTFDINMSDIDPADFKVPPVCTEAFTKTFQNEKVGHVFTSYTIRNLLTGHSSADIFKEKSTYRNKYYSSFLWNHTTSHFCQPYTVHLLYTILLKKLPILSTDAFKAHIKTDNVLTKELCETLFKMFQGSDEDKELALNIVTSCNTDASLYYIMELAKSHDVRSVFYKNTRFKYVREFIDKVSWHNLASMSPSTKFEVLYDKKLITSEIFIEFITKAKESLESKLENVYHNSFMAELFLCKVELKPEFRDVLELFNSIDTDPSVLSRPSTLKSNVEKFNNLLKILENEQTTES